MIFGKLYNSRWSIERTKRDSWYAGGRRDAFQRSGQIKELLPRTLDEASLDGLRGLEGNGANAYFGVLDQLILNDKGIFSFNGRSRRPPLDPVNAMLSFAYSILAHDCASRAGGGRPRPICGVFAQGQAGKDVTCPRSHGRAAPLHGGQVRYHPDKQQGDG